MLYTPLTAGSLFDVLDGKRKAQPKFIRAGAMFRGFLNEDHRPIAIADERSNLHDRWFSYGLALHSLTAQGRSFIVDTLTQADFSDHSPETLAVIRHELSLMRTGPCARPENQSPGHTRLTLPLGVVRANHWTASASALRALNLVRSANNDYAIDQQNMAYLAHRNAGVILTGVKSKRDANYSTLRILGEGYTDRTGRLSMGRNWAQALLHYPTFDATLRWDLGRRARLTLATGDPREIITTLPITDPRFVKAPKRFETLELKGYSPYTAGNASKPIKAVRFKWRKKLVIEFGT
jgi:hypothetical protein